MKKDILKILIITCLLSVFLMALTGCGDEAELAQMELPPDIEAMGEKKAGFRKLDGDAASEKKESAAEEEKGETEEETEGSYGLFAEAFENGEVENNGGYFVRIYDMVYYRVYGTRGLEHVTLWGDISEKEEEVESEIKSYDLNTGESNSICKVIGTGKLFAVTDGFVIKDPLNTSSVLVTLDGTEQRPYLEGHPEAVSEDGRYLVTISYPEAGGNVSHIIYHDGEETARITEEDNEYLTVFGFAGNDLVAMETNYSDNSFIVCSYDETGERTELGEIETEEDMYSYPEFEQLLTDGPNVYFMLAWYEGTGHFLAHWQLYRATCGESGSLCTVVPLGEEGEYIDSPPKAYLNDDGEPAVSEHLEGDLALSEGTYGDLVYYDAPDDMVELKNNFITELGSGDLYGEVMQDAVSFGDRAFILTADVHRDELMDIGWRQAYDLQRLNYIYLPFGEDDLDEEGLAKGGEYLDVVSSQGWGDGEISYDDLIGTWKLYSFEEEGYYGLAEEDDSDEKLVFLEDGSVRVVFNEESEEYEESEVELFETPSEDEDISICFETGEDEDTRRHLDILALNDNIIQVAATAYYEDGHPGGYFGIYLRADE